jgi:hypothetical protein
VTEALATLFDGHDIRVLEKDGEIWFPICDLSKAWGIDPSTIFKQIERHPADFDGCVSDVDNLSTGEIRCVNEPGLYAVLAISSVKNVKNPGAKELIKKFRANAPKAIHHLRKKEIVQVPGTPGLDQEIRHARTLAEKCGKNPDAFLAIALEKCGEKDYAPALLQTPAVVHGEPGWYNITQLVTLCNDPMLNPERLNNFLKNRGFQYRDENRLWRLTPIAMEHGREYLYTSPHQHREIRISWRESVLYASGLKRAVSEGQMALPARA